MARKRYRMDAIDTIDMTPLIDLTFMLLIVFMITFPMLDYSVDVSPPEMTADKLPDKSKTIALDNKGQIIFNNVVVTAEELLRDLKHLQSIDPKAAVLVRADGKRPYDEVIFILKIVKDSGFANVSLVTQAEDKHDSRKKR